MNKQEFIEKIANLDRVYGEKYYVALDDVLDLAKQLDEPQLLKLKNVIARIKDFDLGTQKVWLNEILNELGSDYGVLKYKAGYEQGKLEGEWVGQQLKDADKIRQELNKPVIPKLVAEWIEVAKTVYSLSGGMTYGGPGVNKWLENEDNQRTFALAWFDGYIVEDEKRYLVKIKGICGNYETLNREKHSNKWLFSNREENSLYNTKFTRKELEEAGFGWVFDCPGIEIEEAK